MSKNIISTILKGLGVGATMMVPGVSGGSMAMILGIYDKLITSVSSFRKHKKENLLFLGFFSGGGGLGMFLFAKPLLNLIESSPMLLMYLFIGIVAGGVPMIYQKAKVSKRSPGMVLYPVLGIVIVLLFSMVPADLFQVEMDGSPASLLLLVSTGIIGAAALVLPGISVSYLFLMMGVYDETMKAVSAFDLAYLLPLGIGLIIGILLTTKILEKAMKEHTRVTYLIILGFVAGSVIQVFPGIPAGSQFLFCIAAFVAGFGIIQILNGLERKKESEDPGKTIPITLIK